jgi:hypothetical protein
MRALVSCLAVFNLCFVAEAARAADDPAQAGTRWVGSIKGAKPERVGKRIVTKLQSTEATLVIRSRDGKDYTADFFWGKNSGIAVKGTINDKGSVTMRAVKDLKETNSTDLVDNARLQGTFKGEQFIGRYIVPGNDARSGEIKLELQKPGK